MKKVLLSYAIAGAFAAGVHAQGQNQEGTTGNLPPGLQNRQQLPPGLQNRDELPPGLQRRGTDRDRDRDANNGQTAATNQFGADTSATNSYGSVTTNSSGLTPTSNSGATNQIYDTNTTSQGSSMNQQDQATTTLDRQLLAQIRMKVQTVITTTTTSTGSGQTTSANPIHFLCRDGVVTVEGLAQSQQEADEVLKLVNQTPGVVKVVNNLKVNTGPGNASSGSAPWGVYGGSSGSGSANQSSAAPWGTYSGVTQDQAYTAGDWRLLRQVKQKVRTVVTTTYENEGSAQTGSAQQAQAPVHIICRNGVVTLVGTAPSAQAAQQMTAAVQSVPGVVQVVNNIQINTAVGGTSGQGGSATGSGSSSAAATTNQFGLTTTNQASAGTSNQLGAASTNQLGITSSNEVGSGSTSTNQLGINSSNQVGVASTNQWSSTNATAAAGSTNGAELSPTGRTNDGRVYPDSRGLPPGLEKRGGNLPPGLEKREELPPGLSRDTNSASSGTQ